MADIHEVPGLKHLLGDYDLYRRTPAGIDLADENIRKVMEEAMRNAFNGGLLAVSAYIMGKERRQEGAYIRYGLELTDLTIDGTVAGIFVYRAGEQMDEVKIMPLRAIESAGPRVMVDIIGATLKYRKDIYVMAVERLEGGWSTIMGSRR